MYEKVVYCNANEEEAFLQFELAGTSYCDGTYRVRRERAEFHVLEYVESGTGTIVCGGSELHPEAGSAYLLRKDEPHLYYSSADRPWTKHFVNVRGTLADHLIDAYGLSSGVYPCSGNSGSDNPCGGNPVSAKSNCSDPDNVDPDNTNSDNAESDSANSGSDNPGSSVPACFATIFSLLEKGGAASSTLLPIAFHKLVAAIAAAKVKTEISDAEKIRLYLDEHIRHSVSLPDLSHLVFKSPSQVIRMFKREYDQSPYHYLTQRRLSAASMLLRNTNMSIRQIALELQFADEHYFSNAFKRFAGMSPSRFRKENG